MLVGDFKHILIYFKHILIWRVLDFILLPENTAFKSFIPFTQN